MTPQEELDAARQRVVSWWDANSESRVYLERWADQLIDAARKVERERLEEADHIEHQAAEIDRLNSALDARSETVVQMGAKLATALAALRGLAIQRWGGSAGIPSYLICVLCHERDDSHKPDCILASRPDVEVNE